MEPSVTRTPLIDADIIAYELGFAGQVMDKETNELIIMDWDFVSDLLHRRISDICAQVGATGQPILFLTGRASDFKDNFKPNFREAVAVSKGYKDTRLAEKPFHYHNIREYIKSAYDVRIANGCEADDLMCIEQYSRLTASDTIICSRDKDLRQCPGWHYGWEVGKQAEFGPHYYEALGAIELVRKSNTKISGGGFKFFCSQLLTGDIVDNVGGLRGWGPVKAFDALSPTTSERECLGVVIDVYKAVWPEEWQTKLREQADLLWMVRELNEDGSLKFFNPKDFL